MNSISVNIMICNEARCIKRCIESIQELADEVIIVDTGSTDDTLNIIKDMKIKKIRLYEKKWNHDFSEIRNYMIEKSSRDIIFQLDADEVLNTEISEVRKQIKEMLRREKMVSIVIKDFSGGIISVKTPRIFLRESGFRYYGNVHEQLICDSNFEIVPSTIELLHDGYEDTVMIEKNKVSRNLNLLLEMMKKDENILWHYYYIRDLKIFDQDNDLIYNEILRFLSRYQQIETDSGKNMYKRIEVLKIYFDIFYRGEIDNALINNYQNKYMDNLDYLLILLRLNNLNNEYFIYKIEKSFDNFKEKSKNCLFSSDGTHVIQEIFPLLLQMNKQQIELVISNASQVAKRKMKERLRNLIDLL